jgi:epoxyqueuosine reductase
MDNKIKIIEYSKEIGIDLIGFTEPKQMLEAKKMLVDRKNKGHLCGLEGDNEDERTNILKSYPWVKTVVVIGLNYNINLNKGEDKPRGYICKSGIIIDYHTLVEDKGKQLSAHMESLGSSRSFIHVDKGPFLDREAAFRAGLGWYGKNTCIINPDIGSYFVIGQIFTDLEIQTDNALDNQCGDCDLCVKACPAGAILGDFTINATLCLSYLTQKKGELSPRERKLLSTRLYGCDTCQIVCPKNKGKEIERPHFMTENHQDLRDLFNILNLSNKQFNNIYKSTGSGWRGKGVMQRNALIALENIGTKEVLDKLQQLAQDKNHPLRDKIIEVIQNIKTRKNNYVE